MFSSRGGATPAIGRCESMFRDGVLARKDYRIIGKKQNVASRIEGCPLRPLANSIRRSHSFSSFSSDRLID
jgi:hypothetical protein